MELLNLTTARVANRAIGPNATPLNEISTDSDSPSLGEGGLLVWADSPLESILPHLEKAARVEIHFAAFGDGRGFSLARRIKRDAGFKGEIRASGNLIPDQAVFLARSGFDSILVEEKNVAAFLNMLSVYKGYYQRAADNTASIAEQRQSKVSANG